MGALLVGSPADNRKLDTLHAINDDPRAKQKHTLTVDTAANDTDYTVTIDDQNITFTSDADATKAEIADGLAKAINAEPMVSGTLKATSDGVDKVEVEALVGGTGFDISEADANLSLTENQANAEAAKVPFGRLLIDGGASTSKVTNNRLGMLADAAKLTAQSVELTPEVTNAGLYRIYVTVAGETTEVEFTSSGAATAQEIVEGLKAAFDAAINTDLLSATEDDATLTISAATAGLKFHLDYNDPLTKSDSVEGDDINAEALGLSVRVLNVEQDADGVSKYPKGDTMTITDSGPLVVETEEAVDARDDVWVRLAANGSADKLGGFRKSADAGCVPLAGYRFDKQISATKAVIVRR